MSYEPSHRRLRAIRRNWRIGGTCGVLLMIGAWWTMFAQSVVAARRALQDQLMAIDVQQAAERPTRDRLNQVAAEADRWKQLEAVRRERLPQQHDEAGFLRWASESASACGLTVTDFRPASRSLQGQGEYEGREMMVTAAGKYESICRFLDRLRTCPRMNRVTSFDISPRDAERTNYTFSIQIILFSEPPRSLATTLRTG